MGFHVMLDWVANHTGWDNPWITDPGVPLVYTGDETVLMHGVGAEVDMEEHPIAGDGLTASTALAPWEFYIVRE